MKTRQTLLAVSGLRTEFATRDGVLPAVADVSFDLVRGQVLGLVGESGSGKSVTGFRSKIHIHDFTTGAHLGILPYDRPDLLTLRMDKNRLYFIDDNTVTIAKIGTEKTEEQ